MTPQQMLPSGTTSLQFFFFSDKAAIQDDDFLSNFIKVVVLNNDFIINKNAIVEDNGFIVFKI